MDEIVLLKDVAGYDEEKEEARKIIEILRNYQEYESAGAYVPKGLILSGPSGVGKTLLAKAIAGESGVPFYSFDGVSSDSDEEAAKGIKELFEEARKNAPCIIFIDELDELVSTKSFMSDYSRKVLNALLIQIDGIHSSDGVLVIATTNARGALPSALTRSGRMDKRVSMELPTPASREAILSLYLKKHPSLRGIDAKIIAAKTEGFSGADLKTLINETIIDCKSKGQATMSLGDFERNIPVIRYKDIKKAAESPDDMVCYHEIGHFLAAYELEGKVGDISVERYGEVLGHVQLDVFEEMRSLPTTSKKKAEKDLVILLAGMAGESVLGQDVSSGATDDMQKAVDIIDSLCHVGAYGFDLLDPNFTPMARSPISQKLLERLEQKRAELLRGAYAEAKRIIQRHLAEAKELFASLKERGGLSQAEAQAIMGKDKAAIDAQ